jgi:RNA polymerase sigma factor (sigma-70 family)
LDSEAPSFATLVGPIQDQMLRSIWRITRTDADAEDALQESLTIVWQRRERIARHPRPQALVLRIAVHCACDVLRAKLRRQTRETPLADAQALPAAACALDARLRDQELHAAVVRALVRLPTRQATAVVLRFVLEMSYDEIAAALACAPATARVHVNRACQRMRRLLAQWGPSRCSEGQP